jgi:asparagine synthase (glutamine-hydrolysing)
VEIVRYWEPNFRIDADHTERYFVEELRSLLEDAAEIQMRCDVPLGTSLSGGLDSSIITTLASQKYPGRLKTFTGAFREGPEFDERPYAQELAKHCRAEMFRVYPTEAQFIELLPDLIHHMDEPAAGPGLFPQYIVSRLASEEVKVLLGGQGGDEIFGGYTRYLIAYLEQALKGAIYETNVEGEHIVSLQSILPNLPALKQYVPMLQKFWSSDVFEPMDVRYFRLIGRCDGDWSTLSQDFQKDFDFHEVFSRFQAVFNHPDTLSYYNKMVHFDLVASLPALLQVEDRTSMAVSLESRVPLLDYRIVELILSMPPRMKFKGAEMKYILKKAVKDMLPAKILGRKDKMGFPVPFHLWARNHLRGFLQDVLMSKTCRERGIFDPQGVEALIDNESAFGRHLWGLVCLELWFQNFIDNKHD